MSRRRARGAILSCRRRGPLEGDLLGSLSAEATGSMSGESVVSQCAHRDESAIAPRILMERARMLARRGVLDPDPRADTHLLSMSGLGGRVSGLRVRAVSTPANADR